MKNFAAAAEAVKDVVKVCCWDLDDPQVLVRLSCGIQSSDIIHFFSDEVRAREAQCIAFIQAKAGLYEYRLGARSCSVQEVPRKSARDFLNSYHIQGANRLGVIYFGLYHQDQLYGVLSLGRHSRQIVANRIVLDRLCFRAGVQIRGGSSKLLKAAVQWASTQGYDELLTFSDNRWTDGSLYQLLGFELERNLKCDYLYVKNGVRYSKQSQKKKAVGCPEHLTEFEWAKQRGLCRIYDAGKKRWVLNLKPGKHLTRNDLSSQRCALQYQEGVFHHAHVRGYYVSRKNARSVYYASSYELRCLFLLDRDPKVASFCRGPAFQGAYGWRNPDLLVMFTDGHEEIWEIKPQARLDSGTARFQVKESQQYAEEQGYGFRVWTEKDSGLKDDHALVAWARRYLKHVGEPKFFEQAREQRRNIRRRHYAKLQADKVEIWCDFCQITHTVMRQSYERNLKRHGGTYVCGRHGGHMAGKRPKPFLKKTNPYKAEGRKQCTQCAEVLPFDMYHKRAASFDGLAAECKTCSSRRHKIAYKKKVLKNS